MPYNSPMNKRAAHIVTTLALVAWCVFIFAMSAKPGDDSDALSLGFLGQLAGLFVPGFGDMSPSDQLAAVQPYNHFIRKLAHFSEYALLGMLAFGALRVRGQHNAAVAWAFSALYACTDEFHQLFVHGRTGLITDVFIDSAGALVGIAFLILCDRLSQAYFVSFRKSKNVTK